MVAEVVVMAQWQFAQWPSSSFIDGRFSTWNSPSGRPHWCYSLNT